MFQLDFAIRGKTHSSYVRGWKEQGITPRKDIYAFDLHNYSGRRPCQADCGRKGWNDNKGWRKKNACFSNNCNFAYFQYKKIMSTPKQPVINAVLIIYIDYSITENYIGKMASFLHYTRPVPLLKVLHHIY